MKQFDLKKYLAENKATFHSSLNENIDIDSVDVLVDGELTFTKNQYEYEPNDPSLPVIRGIDNIIKKGYLKPKVKTFLKNEYPNNMDENKATFHAALNEDNTASVGKSFFITKGDESMDIKPGKYTIVKSYMDNDETVYDIKDKEGKIITVTQDYVQGKGYWKNSPLASNTMKESKLRSKIREMVLAEMNVDMTDETAGYDFLAELESILDEEIEEGIYDMDITSAPHTNVKGTMGDYDPKRAAARLAKLKNFGPKDIKISPEADEIDDEDLEAASDYFDLLREKKNEKQTDEETTDDVADEEEVDTTIDVDTDEVDPNVKAVQDALTQAQAAAQSLGDQKLSNQIGNTITYFTRAHISKPNNLR
jgi:hypothetical protein